MYATLFQAETVGKHGTTSWALVLSSLPTVGAVWPAASPSNCGSEQTLPSPVVAIMCFYSGGKVSHVYKEFSYNLCPALLVQWPSSRDTSAPRLSQRHFWVPHLGGGSGNTTDTRAATEYPGMRWTAPGEWSAPRWSCAEDKTPPLLPVSDVSCVLVCSKHRKLKH